uniref:Uncharacterized protein n=1 Tax=Myoviridae sp. ctTOm1 TaxID=2826657 RepID=A0A8S5N532_9CAUD|nr:MAG TPA: hypothetical protein [Myoviridae sp. ctTOm1]
MHRACGFWPVCIRAPARIFPHAAGFSEKAGGAHIFRPGRPEEGRRAI